MLDSHRETCNELGEMKQERQNLLDGRERGYTHYQPAVKLGNTEIEPQKPSTIARSLAIGNPADGHYAIKCITQSGGWSEDVSDPEIVDAIQLLAESEGIFTETAGGVTLGCARKLIKNDRILPHETTVLCITGNGLKTTDVLTGEYEAEQPIPAKLAEFERLYGEHDLPV